MGSERESMCVQCIDGVAEVVLTGPGKGNAMGPEFFRELPDVFDELDGDENVRAVVLRGQHGTFSYGLNLFTMLPELLPYLEGADATAHSKNRRLLADAIARMQRGFDAVERCRKPVIAAVTGACIGAGLDLIAACDIRLASRSAVFSLREVKLSLVADLGSLQRLPQIIGQSHTRELAYTGRDVDANRALRIQLVSDVFDDEDTLMQAARLMARDIAQNPRLAVEGAKRVLSLSDASSTSRGEALAALWNTAFASSQDIKEAVRALSERRTPSG
jgi:enoyl-CoA hydratase